MLQERSELESGADEEAGQQRGAVLHSLKPGLGQRGQLGDRPGAVHLNVALREPLVLDAPLPDDEPGGGGLGFRGGGLGAYRSGLGVRVGDIRLGDADLLLLPILL